MIDRQHSMKHMKRFTYSIIKESLLGLLNTSDDRSISLTFVEVINSLLYLGLDISTLLHELFAAR
jgi:hypothetical protein